MRRGLLTIVSIALLSACDSSATSDKPAEAVDEQGTPANAKSECDGDKLTELAAALEAASPETKGTVVAKGLGDACALPEVVSPFLAAPRVGLDESGVDLSVMATEVSRAALTKACPGAAIVIKQVQQAPAAERMALLYDRCNFARFDLMDKATWLRGGPASPVPWIAYRWLLEQGVEVPQAKMLGEALLLHDRKRWNAEDLTVAALGQQLAPIADRVELYAGVKDIRVGEVHLTEGDGRPLGAAAFGGEHNELITEALTRARQRRESAGETAADVLLIAADTGLPHRAVQTLMHSAEAAGFSSFEFVAKSGPAQYGVVPLAQRWVVRSGGGALPANCNVRIEPDGFFVHFDGDTSAASIPVASSGDLDFDALAKKLAEEHKRHPKATRVKIAPAKGVELGAVLRTVATLRGSDCDVTGECLLKDVTVVPEIRDPALAAVGVLGVLGSPGGAFAIGNDDEDVWGGLTGSEAGEAFGVGGLGLVGTGRGGGGTGEAGLGLGSTGTIGKGGGGTGTGYGRGSGAGFGGRGKKVPRVRQSKATVTGSLDKDIIRRIVRAHINEVRYCYNQGLVKDPKLSGKVTVSFSIGGTGKVTSSKVKSTTLGDENVGTCVAKAVKRWKFPRPTGGGVVVVSYPFVLSPG